MKKTLWAIGLLMVYFLSYGPVFYLGEKAGVKADGIVGSTLSCIYWPCVQIQNVRPYVWYNNLFVVDPYSRTVQIDLP